MHKGIDALSYEYRHLLAVEEIGYRTLSFHLSKIDDPRKEKGKRHQLIHILILTIIGILRGFSDFDNMVDDLKYDEQELSEKLGMKHGIPSHDTFSRVFRIIDAKAFMKAFIDWSYSMTVLNGNHVAFDGKAVRAACAKVESENMPYIVNSYVCEKGIVLGQLLIDKKTNEIKGIPELMELLDLEGCTVTIDAIGCQKSICDLLKKKKASFVLPVKENQKLMHEALQLYIQDSYDEWKHEEEQVAKVREKGKKTEGYNLYLPMHKKMDVWHDVDPKAEHGREPGDRLYVVMNDLSVIDRKEWPHVKAVGMTVRKRTVIQRKNGEDISETSTEVNTWILSKEMSAKEFGKIVRGHWGIENTLHYVLDQSFNEDRCTARKDNALENLAQMRKICYNFMKLDPAVQGKSKTKIFTYYRRNIDEVIKLIFFEIPKAVHSEE